MTHWTQIIAENALGERCNLTDCEIFCSRAGENDYGDPAAIRFPKSDGIVQLTNDFGAPRFYNQNGESVSCDNIDWEGSEPPEKIDLPRTRKFTVELQAWESVLVTVEVEQTAEMDEDDVIQQAQDEALKFVNHSEDPSDLDHYSHNGWSYCEGVIEKDVS